MFYAGPATPVIGKSRPGSRTARLLQLLLSVMLIAQLSGCASLPDYTPEPEPPRPDLSQTTLYQKTAAAAASYPGRSGFFPLNDGIDALAARLWMIESAEKTLDLQYYIWHDDMVGRVLHNRLLAVADKGVQVRLLLDDLDTKGKDPVLAMLNAHPNIQVRIFNPFANRDRRWLDAFGRAAQLNHRMHNKAIIADDAVVIMGGRNIGAEYFNASTDVGFSDMDVLAIGPVAREVEASFSQFWQSPWSYPHQALYRQPAVSAPAMQAFRQKSDQYLQQAARGAYAAALNSRWREHTGVLQASDFSWGHWQLFADQPEKIVAPAISSDSHLAPHLLQVLAASEQDILIISPYFVPGEVFSQLLSDKVAKGIRVRVLTNSLAANDVPLVHAGYSRYREMLLEGGVELFEYKASDPMMQPVKKSGWTGSSHSSLHGKVMGFDLQRIFVGSFNLDARSVNLNTELGVLFDNPALARRLSTDFDAQVRYRAYQLSLDPGGGLIWSTGTDQRQQFDKEPESHWWNRLLVSVFSFFVPESQL